MGQTDRSKALRAQRPSYHTNGRGVARQRRQGVEQKRRVMDNELSPRHDKSIALPRQNTGTQDREQSLSTLRVVASGSDLRRRSTFRCIKDSVVAAKNFTSADSSKIAPTSPSTIIGFNTHLGLWTVRVCVHKLHDQS